MSAGDFTVGDTLYFMFTTRAFATGIPFVLAGTPVVSAYEDNGTTQITAGITLGVSHDSVVGMNLLTVVATGGNGFETGKQYNLVVTTGTVDSVSVVGEVVGTFSLGATQAVADIAALNDITVSDVLTTQMTEAYAADNAAPTVAQSLMMIQQILGDFAISSTTLTVKKVDGSTTAATYTLNDATNPTSITRAT